MKSFGKLKNQDFNFDNSLCFEFILNWFNYLLKKLINSDI